EEFDRGLEAARHAGRRLARSQPHQPATQRAERNGPEDRIEIEDGKIDDRRGLVILEMRQVVDDVFTRARTVFFSSHLRCLPDLSFIPCAPAWRTQARPNTPSA